ncbi:MAG: hypothetical protein QGI45_11690 [Myxococcota bacterium]|jgi:hypothetical protein|nr:hypothetical protein [Myxococcota bacterium]
MHYLKLSCLVLSIGIINCGPDRLSSYEKDEYMRPASACPDGDLRNCAEPEGVDFGDEIPEMEPVDEVTHDFDETEDTEISKEVEDKIPEDELIEEIQDEKPEKASQDIVLDTVVQNIELKEGWNMISFYVLPQDDGEAREMDAVFAPVAESAYIVKDVQGNFYKPDAGYNGIGTARFGQGYKVQVTEDVTLSVEGFLAESDVGLSFNQGWNMFGTTLEESISPDCFNDYLREHAPDAPIDVLKNNDGQTYMPVPGASETMFNGMGDLNAGQGYELFLHGPALVVWSDVVGDCVE